MYPVKETHCQDTFQKVWFPRKKWQFDPFFPLVILTNHGAESPYLEVTPTALAGFPSVITICNRRCKTFSVLPFCRQNTPYVPSL